MKVCNYPKFQPAEEKSFFFFFVNGVHWSPTALSSSSGGYGNKAIYFRGCFSFFIADVFPLVVIFSGPCFCGCDISTSFSAANDRRPKVARSGAEPRREKERRKKIGQVWSFARRREDALALIRPACSLAGISATSLGFSPGFCCSAKS